MNNKIFIIALIILFLVINFASAGNDLTNYLYEKTPAWIQKFLGFGLIEGFGSAFIRGFFAGLIIYGFYWFIKFFRWINKKSLIRKDEEEFEESQTRWFNILVGRFWKIPLIGIFFAVLMQIPIINKLLYFILLDFYFTGSIVRVVTLAFLIGFLPALVENFFKEKYRFKLKKKVLDAKKIGAITSAQAKIISEGI